MKVKQSLVLAGVFLFSFLSVVTSAAAFTTERTYTLPVCMKGVRQPVLLLNGTWDFKYSTEDSWTTIQVPGEVAMQGFAIEHDKPFFYRKDFTIPSDYAGKRIILRFDGVYSHAKLSVNGKFIREHHGGFTRWETDITSFVSIGKKNKIELEVTDRLDEISYASGYAHHPIGGILRDVTLFALPESYIYNVKVETPLDSLYENADLRLSCEFLGKENVEIELRLKDRAGSDMALPQSRFMLSDGQNAFSVPVNNPLKWDAEHPNLYELEMVVFQNGKETCRFNRNIGFREVKIVKDRMLVNGRQVKLRGACRHDIHPTLGRTTTAELDSLDVVLFKQANMNFVRTSHYPPTERFLNYCDRYGIYVESETAVCFVNTHRQKNYAPAASQNDSNFTERYLGQCREMVNSFSSHPSIILWSIGNESTYGSNFQKCWDWVKANDSTRPVIFSYPGSQGKDAVKVYDILSMHYQDVNGNLKQWGKQTTGFQGHGIPALFDEWAHPACYTYATLQNDPNIREFWGKSLDMMWSGLFDAPGGLGGAIWGYVDELFMLPEPKVGYPFWKEFARTAKPKDYQGNCVGYGEWGIVDIWRRQKPEFWSTKKAYSPIRILSNSVTDFVSGHRLMIPVYNRYDHTFLDEVRMDYSYQGKKNSVVLAAIGPHQKGILTLPAENWQEGEKIFIEFFTLDGQLIDAYNIVLGKDNITYPALLNGKSLLVKDKETAFVICGNGFEIPFDKTTGLIVNAKRGNEILIEKGPFLNVYANLNHLSGAEVRKMADHFCVADGDWSKKSFDLKQREGNVYVELTGTYKEVKVDFYIKITADGQLFVDYQVSNIPNGFLREMGIAFYLSDSFQKLDWSRKGYWNYYPKDAFAGNEGCTSFYNSTFVAYGERPKQSWQSDTHNYFYWSDAGANCKKPLVQMAKGMKENIYYYRLSMAGRNNHTLSVISPTASVACRLNKQPDESIILYVNNRWDYPEIAWGNYCKRLEALPCWGTIQMRFF